MTVPAKAAAAALASAALAVSLAGCSSLSHGTVTGKGYDPPWTYYTSLCVAYGKYGCNVRTLLPVSEPADYVLNLKDGKQTGSVDVDEASWDAARVGEHWPPAAGTAK